FIYGDTIMKQSKLSKAMSQILLASVLGLGISSVALAQDETETNEQQQSDTLTLDDVKVTARRTEESAQDIPVAVTNFSREDIQDAQAENLDGLAGAVPNMNLVLGRGSASSANIYIRGIGQPDALQTFDPGVGVYVDGVYMSRI